MAPERAGCKDWCEVFLPLTWSYVNRATRSKLRTRPEKVLVQSFGVQHVAQRLVAQEARQVIAEDVGDARVLLLDGAGGVRADDDIGHFPQRRVGQRRFALEDVEGGAGQPPILQVA